MYKKTLLTILSLIIIGQSIVYAKTKTTIPIKSFEESISEGIHSKKTNINISENITPEEAVKRYYILINSNADFWYIDENLQCITNGGKVKKVITKKKYDNKTIENGNKIIKETSTKIAELAKKEKTDFDKIKFVYDYMIEKYGYDYGLVNTNIYELYSKKFATCTAFSVAFKDIMNMLDIESGIVYSYPIRHEWNVVKLNGEWYNIDPSGGVIYNQCDKSFKYDCFLKSDTYIELLGYNGKQKPEGVNCTSTKYEKYIHK